MDSEHPRPGPGPDAAAVPARRARPTMRDVAAAAGVSLKTVSRVLNREGGYQPETAAAVTRAVAELDFRRNDAAAALRRVDQASKSIGLVIEDVANPFYSVLTKAAEDVARMHGYLLLSGSSGGSPDTERQILQTFSARRVDGILLVASHPDIAFLDAEIRAGTVVVAVDRPLEGLRVDTVQTANRDGARAGVEHLLEGGHRRIAILTEMDTYTGRERLAGWRDALTGAGLEPDDGLVRLAHSPDEATRAVTDLLAVDHPPTALFTVNNLMTLGALRALGDLRHRIALVGYDDFEFSDLMDPPVTVVRQNVTGLGRCAAELLFARLAGDTAPPRNVVLGTELIARGSGELAPGGAA